MYTLGVNEKLLKENPLINVGRALDKNYVIRYLKSEEKEEERMYKAIKEVAPQIEDIVTTALQTAMRKGEVLSLTWFQIDYNYNIIKVLESKSGKGRDIPISEKLLAVLKSIPRTSEYVFPNPDTGKPYTDIKKSWATVMKKAGIKNFRFHDLRHTAITRMVEKAIPLTVVREIAGHSKIETTMRYTHISSKQKIEAIEVLNSYN
jgi:integrase